MPCPFCGNGYVTASGLSHHLETGSCPQAPNITRDTLHHAIRSRDRGDFITKPAERRLIEWQATAETWNGDGYECYLCHREFNALSSLNQHLTSPAHRQKIYRCPNHRGCSLEFVSLAGLFNHLESESCGYIRFENVRKSLAWLPVGQGGRKLLGAVA